MKPRKKSNLVLGQVLVSILLLLTAEMQAQDVSHLPRDKAATVLQLRNELFRNLSSNCHISRDNIIAALDRIDPSLVGRSFVFDKQWIELFKHEGISRQQFNDYRNRADEIYDSYVRLTGRCPQKGEKVLIIIEKLESSVIGACAHAHGGENLICFFSSGVRDALKEIKCGTWDYHVMHELAHTFAQQPGSPWSVGAHATTELFVSYVMETIPGVSYSGGHARGTVVSGEQHRRNQIDRALSRIRPNPAGADREEVLSLLLLSLVSKVGWETYETVYRTYEGRNLRNPSDDPALLLAQQREFLLRIEKISGQQGVLRSFPDKGTLFDYYFDGKDVRPIVPDTVANPMPRTTPGVPIVGRPSIPPVTSPGAPRIHGPIQRTTPTITPRGSIPVQVGGPRGSIPVQVGGPRGSIPVQVGGPPGRESIPVQVGGPRGSIPVRVGGN